MNELLLPFAKAVLWLVLLYEGWLLAAGPKFTVLYLRRFRVATAPAVVTAALEQGLSKRYRVVTLDDATFPPLEVPRLYRRLSRYGGVALWLVVVLVVLAFLLLLYTQFSPTLSGFVYGLVLAGTVGVLPLGGMFVGFSWMMLVAVAALLLHRWRVRKRARILVRCSDDVYRAEALVADLSRWRRRSTFLAPQATVVGVTDDLWREVVTRLVRCAHIVLVDISVPSENLDWELALLAGQSFRRTVFVADWRSPAAPPAGHPCVLYRTAPTGRERKVFLEALTRALDEQVEGLPSFEFQEWILEPVTACVRTLLVLLLALILTLGVVRMVV
jgi:hypothetical protein